MLESGRLAASCSSDYEAPVVVKRSYGGVVAVIPICLRQQRIGLRHNAAKAKVAFDACRWQFETSVRGAGGSEQTRFGTTGPCVVAIDVRYSELGRPLGSRVQGERQSEGAYRGGQGWRNSRIPTCPDRKSTHRSLG